MMLVSRVSRVLGAALLTAVVTVSGVGGVGGVCGGVGGERIAHAQNAGAAAEAQTLFDEGRKLMNKGDFAHACPKFAASQEADPAAGTLLNLANCYQKNGQTASAWVTFKDAAGAARASKHPDWEKRASDHAAALEKVLSRLTVRLAPGAQAPSDSSLKIRRDDTTVNSSLLGTAIPVDPGNHTIEASAPGKKPFRASVDVGANGDRKEIVIPALEDLPPAAPTAAPVADAAATAPAFSDGRSGSGQRTLGLTLAAVGVASGIVGVVTGIVAISKNSSAQSICPNAGACPSQDAVNDGSTAHTFGNVSTVTLIAGGALAAGGVLTYLLAPRGSSPTAASATGFTASPLVGHGQAGLVFASHF